MKKYFALSLLLLGCTQAEDKLSEELKEKVMGLHDVLMPKTEQIQSLKTLNRQFRREEAEIRAQDALDSVKRRGGWACRRRRSTPMSAAG